MTRRVCVITVALGVCVGCAAGGARPPIVSRSSDSCPPGPDETPYTISVSNHSGDTANFAIRQAIANALASTWSQDLDDDEPTPPPELYHALRELSAYVPRPARYGLGKWRVRAGDSAAVFLTYRAGHVPVLEVPPAVHPELRTRITKVTSAAIETAVNAHAVRDTMPLELRASGATAAATLEVRIGWRPRPGAAIAAFALRDNEPSMRGGMFALRYPEEYRERNIEGSVLVAFILTDSGTVDESSVRFIASDGDLFARAVREVLPRARYTPFTIDCVAFPLATAQRFNFRLRR